MPIIRKLNASIGGFEGFYSIQLIANNTIKYKGVAGDEECLQLTETKISAFLTDLLKTNLLSWKKDYDNHLMILDGTQWAFEIATESFYFRSGGSNNYPANIEFNRLLRAIRKLIERDFR